jgi:hypothetical protein
LAAVVGVGRLTSLCGGFSHSGPSALVASGGAGEAEGVMDKAGRPPGAGVDVVEPATSGPVAVRVRLPYVDNLRTAMVAWIIGGHALLGYAVIGGWPYVEVHQITAHVEADLPGAFATRSELALVAVLRADRAVPDRYLLLPVRVVKPGGDGA